MHGSGQGDARTVCGCKRSRQWSLTAGLLAYSLVPGCGAPQASRRDARRCRRRSARCAGGCSRSPRPPLRKPTPRSPPRRSSSSSPSRRRRHISTHRLSLVVVAVATQGVQRRTQRRCSCRRSVRRRRACCWRRPRRPTLASAPRSSAPWDAVSAGRRVLSCTTSPCSVRWHRHNRAARARVGAACRLERQLACQRRGLGPRLPGGRGTGLERRWWRQASPRRGGAAAAAGHVRGDDVGGGLQGRRLQATGAQGSLRCARPGQAPHRACGRLAARCV